MISKVGVRIAVFGSVPYRKLAGTLGLVFTQ